MSLEVSCFHYHVHKTFHFLLEHDKLGNFMTESQGIGVRLSTWKEIAKFLDYSVRQCVRKEKTQGLPVHRIRGSGKGRVFSYAEELDQWLKQGKPEENQDVSAGHQITSVNHSYRTIIAAVLGFALIASSVFFLSSSNGKNPSDFRISPSSLIILDGKGHELWRANLSLENLIEEASYKYHFQTKRYLLDGQMDHPFIVFKDIQKDGKTEVLFSVQTRDEIGEGKLICFNNRGEIMWEFQAGRRLRIGSNEYSKDYRIEGIGVEDIDRDGRFEILVISYHILDFPCQLAILNEEGTLEGEYWNSGYIRDYALINIQKDGPCRLVLTGTNNEYKKACLILLDPLRIEGCSPQKNKAFQCEEIGPGSHEHYILLPRTEVDSIEGPLESGSRIYVLENEQICVETVVSRLFYQFDFNLQPIDVKLTHAYQRKYSSYSAQGKIKNSMNSNSSQELMSEIKFFKDNQWSTYPSIK